MKRILILTILTLTTTLSNIQGQNCNQLPDTIFNCGLEMHIQLDSIDGTWEILCDAEEYGAAVTQVDSGFLLQFSACGSYAAVYSYPDCPPESVILLIDDPSSTVYNLVGDNNFDYDGGSCPTGGSSCDNVVSIAGVPDPLNPVWDICHTFSCSYDHIVTSELPDGGTTCIVDTIIYDVITGFNQSESCYTIDQSAFVTIDSETGEVISNDFFEFVDSIGFVLFDSDACPPSSSCSFNTMNCLDSVTVDTLLLPFPVHVGGQWTIIEGGDTILCSDITGFTYGTQNLVLEIEPGADYFGPDGIDFSLYEVIGSDTMATSEVITLTVWWMENFIYDTIEYLDYTYHYSDSLICQSCGGTTLNTNFGGIPEVPEQPCSPISLGFGDPCACGSFDVIVTGEDFLDCNTPCTTLLAEAGNSETMWTDGNWFLNGSLVGAGNEIIVCEGGTYNFVASTDIYGCPLEGSVVIIKEVLPIPDLNPAYINCFTPCAIISTGLEDNPFVSVVFYYPDGTVSTDALPVCEIGTMEIEVISNNTGCSEFYAVDILEDPTSYQVSITDSGPITCANPCVQLVPEVSPFDSAMEFAWIGPNGFSSAEQIIEVCQAGQYDLLVSLGDCIEFSSITIVESFTTETENIDESICFGSCFEFLGEVFCEPGTYEIEGNCDSIYILNLDIESQVQIEKYEIICSGGSVIVDGVEYTSAVQTSYSIDEGGCEVLVNLVVEEFNLDINLSGEFSISCDMPETLVEASSSNSINQFEWYNQQNEFLGIGNEVYIDEPGLYFCRNSASVADCEAELYFEIEDYTIEPEIEVGGPYVLNCNTSVILAVTYNSVFPVEFMWTGPDINSMNAETPNPTVTQAGLYMLEVTTIHGCASNVVVNVGAVSELTYDIQTEASCDSENSGRIEVNVVSGGLEPFMYRVEDGEWSTNSVFENLEGKTYSLEIMQADECTEQKNVEVLSIEKLNPSWNISSTAQVDLCSSEAITVDFDQSEGQKEGWLYEWSDGFATIDRRIDSSGDYSLNIDSGCEAETYEFSVTNSQIDEQQIVFVPNTFTPNDDGVNDVFYCSSPYDLDKFELQVYDRWGSKIFEGQSIDDRWNGLIRESGSNGSSYSYRLVFEVDVCADKKETFTEYGTILLMK